MMAWPYSIAGLENRRWSVAQQSVKQRVLEAVEALPADATIEDAMERLYFLAKIQRGLEQADAGDTMTHEEAKKRLLK
jgi:predicted transcriptional regulator